MSLARLPDQSFVCVCAGPHGFGGGVNQDISIFGSPGRLVFFFFGKLGRVLQQGDPSARGPEELNVKPLEPEFENTQQPKGGRFFPRRQFMTTH